MRIALISCVAKKKNCRAMAKDMYISPLFKSAYRYAQRNADKIFILSANAKNGLYGLLEETDLIEPYNETLNTKPVDEIKEWARNIIAALARKADLQNDEFILLAGEKYRKYLIGSLRNHSIPIKKMPIGKQLAFYKKANL